jgi:hypothetical protein
MRGREPRQPCERRRRGLGLAAVRVALRRVQRSRADAGEAALRQAEHIVVPAAAGASRETAHIAGGGIHRKDRRDAFIVGRDQHFLAIARPVPDVRPAVPVPGQLARVALLVEQGQRGPNHMRAGALLADGGDGAPVGREARILRGDGIALRQQPVRLRDQVEHHEVVVVDAVLTRHAPGTQRPPAVGSDVQLRLDRELGLGIGRQVHPLLAFRVAKNQVRAGAVGVLVQPAVPIPHRLPAEVARAGALLRAIDGRLALLVVRNAREHRREQHHAIRAGRKAEALHAQRFVGELPRLAAFGRQQPDLHALLGVFVGLDVVGLAIGEEAQGAVMAEAGRCFLGLAAGELHDGRAVGGDLPQVGDVFDAIAVEALDGDGEPSAVGGGGDVGYAPQRDMGGGGVDGRRHGERSWREGLILCPPLMDPHFRRPAARKCKSWGKGEVKWSAQASLQIQQRCDATLGASEARRFAPTWSA